MVVLNLLADESFCFLALMTMVNGFNTGFEAERDEQANGDGEEVQEEVADAREFRVRGG